MTKKNRQKISRLKQRVNGVLGYKAIKLTQVVGLEYIYIGLFSFNSGIHRVVFLFVSISTTMTFLMFCDILEIDFFIFETIKEIQIELFLT